MVITQKIYGLASVTWQKKDLNGQMGVSSVIQAGPKDNHQEQNIWLDDKFLIVCLFIKEQNVYTVLVNNFAYALFTHLMSVKTLCQNYKKIYF